MQLDLAARAIVGKLDTRLERLDPVTADRLSPGDTLRTARALEVAIIGSISGVSPTAMDSANNRASIQSPLVIPLIIFRGRCSTPGCCMTMS